MAASPDYDPECDSIVRVEANRLRARLREYYETDGRMMPSAFTIAAR